MLTTEAMIADVQEKSAKAEAAAWAVWAAWAWECSVSSPHVSKGCCDLWASPTSCCNCRFDCL